MMHQIHRILRMMLLVSLIMFAGIYVWVAFDIHNRIQFAMMAQIPVLALLLLAKITKPKDKFDC